EIAVGGRITPEQIARAANLLWMNFWSAGLDNKPAAELAARGVQVTNSSGIHGVPIAEHLMGMMLMFARSLHLYRDSQRAGEWERSGQTAHDELFEKTLGI